MLRVIVPAPDLGLLSVEELRAAVGETGTGRDAALTALGLTAAGMIAEFCQVVPGIGAGPGDPAPPITLRDELVEEVVQLTRSTESLILARRYVGSIVSVSVGGVDMAPERVEFDRAAALAWPVDEAGRERRWPCGRVTIRYWAGFGLVPEGLKQAARALVRHLDSQGSRDPLLRAQQVDGVGREEWQISAGMAMERGLPADIAGMLSPFVTLGV